MAETLAKKIIEKIAPESAGFRIEEVLPLQFQHIPVAAGDVDLGHEQEIVQPHFMLLKVVENLVGVPGVEGVDLALYSGLLVVKGCDNSLNSRNLSDLPAFNGIKFLAVPAKCHFHNL